MSISKAKAQPGISWVWMGHASAVYSKWYHSNCGFCVFVCWGSDEVIDPCRFCGCLNAWLLPPCYLVHMLDLCSQPLSNFNSLVAVAYSQWLNVLIMRIRCPFWWFEHNTNSKWIANDIHSLQILHSCKFKICCLGLLFQTVAFRSFRPRTSMNLNRRKSVKIMRRATMTRTCPGWSWSTCSRPGIRHLSCHGWLCFLNNHVIMFVLFVSKHVFTFWCCCGLWNHHAIVLPCVKYCGTQATDAVTETFKSKRILGKARGVVLLCLKAHWFCDGKWTFFLHGLEVYEMQYLIKEKPYCCPMKIFVGD